MYSINQRLSAKAECVAAAHMPQWWAPWSRHFPKKRVGWLWLWSITPKHHPFVITKTTCSISCRALPRLGPKDTNSWMPTCWAWMLFCTSNRTMGVSWTTHYSLAALDPNKYHFRHLFPHHLSLVFVPGSWQRADNRARGKTALKIHGGHNTWWQLSFAASSGMAQNTQRMAEQPGMKLPVRGEGCKCN